MVCKHVYNMKWLSVLEFGYVIITFVKSLGRRFGVVNKSLNGTLLLLLLLCVCVCVCVCPTLSQLISTHPKWLTEHTLCVFHIRNGDIKHIFPTRGDGEHRPCNKCLLI